jgi:hypothetical protein
MSKKIEQNQSRSLWNYTLSPGWRDEEVRVLKLLLQKFGIGKWKKIQNSGCLPGKQIGQIYMQTQRLVGQQSLGEFIGLRLDLQKVFRDNMKKKGVKRKNNSIINFGDNQTREERNRLIEENRRNYGLSEQAIQEIKLPRYKFGSLFPLEAIESDMLSTLEKLEQLAVLRQEI